MNTGEFQSGQMGQTVNLLSTTSVVRIHLPPPNGRGMFVPRPSLHCAAPYAAERMKEMCQIAFEIPSEVLYDTKMNPAQALSYARKAVALQYYVKNGVSLGYCAQIAGVNKEEFIRFLAQNGVSIFRFDDKDEFVEEMNNA